MQNSKFKIQNLKSGFGLLEVLISVGILVMVMGAAIFAGRISVRNNLIANQRAQAYNLVRQDLEVARTIRDSTWIDENLNNWDDPFATYINDGKTHAISFVNKEWVFDVDGSKEINLDGTKFSKAISFNKIEDDDLNKELRILASSENINTLDVTSIIIVKAVVSWQSYGKTYSVTGAINLAGWKPQI